jgi:hypothetical protein
VPVARARVVGANVCQSLSLSLWRYCSLLSGAASRLPGGRGWRWGRPNPGFHPGPCFPGGSNPVTDPAEHSGWEAGHLPEPAPDVALHVRIRAFLYPFRKEAPGGCRTERVRQWLILQSSSVLSIWSS